MDATNPVTPTSQTNRPSSWLIILPLVSLFATAVLWYRTDRNLGEIRRAIAGLNRGPVIDLAGTPTLGPADAPVVLIEFSDYECPFCIRHTRETMPQIDANYIRPGRIQYAFRDFPIDQLHPEAIRAHEAGRCAAEQDKFWQLHKHLFSAPGTHTTQALEGLAGQAGLDVRAFAECLASGRTTAAVRAAGEFASDLGATGTPAFFVGVRDPATEEVRVVRAITGAQPYEVFAKTLDEVLRGSR
jgi:protein-disulfide isomerase